MKIDIDDPRITAYALGELDDDERAELERQLEQSPKGRQLVQELQALASQLTEELGQEPELELSEAQHEAIAQRLQEEQKPSGEEGHDELEERRRANKRASDTGPGRRQPWILRHKVATSLAAMLLLAVGASTMMFAGYMATAPEIANRRIELPGASMGPSHGGEAKASSAPANQPVHAGYWRATEVDKLQRTSPTVNAGEGRGLNRVTRGNSQEGLRLIPAQDRGLMHNSEKKRLTGEEYQPTPENRFQTVARAPLSTFSIDVDTASYANVRRFLTRKMLPPAAAVRIEELVNYFGYAYPEPTGQHPFSVNVELGPAPWQRKHRLVRIGLRGRQIQKRHRPASNLVFLIDVSGSMSDLTKLPLLRRGMKLLVDQLGEQDRVALVVYAGASGLVLRSTACTRQNRPKILSALERLQAGGSTNGGAGIQLAYDVAVANYIKGGTNRVLLATDGDFNVGLRDRGALVKLISQKAKSGVFLSVLGFGMGNLKDATLEQLADKGNGNYAYIDSIREARKVLVEQMTGTLITIAKDVKIQVEFNPARVQAYRLVGYENRRLAARDFADDKKDAGEIGAGHTVTALYELVPPGVKLVTPATGPLRYQRPAQPAGRHGKELLTVKLRYKQPEASRSTLLSVPAGDQGNNLERTSADFKFAAAVAWFGMALRGSAHAGKTPYPSIIELGHAGLASDRNGRRAEFLDLVKRASRLNR